MWLDGSPALHVTDTATRLSAAELVVENAADYVWDSFVSCWTAVYAGFPRTMRTDACYIFVSKGSENLTKLHGIVLQISGVECHNSLDMKERLHALYAEFMTKYYISTPTLAVP
jgi:hypothetical protein